MIQFPRETIEDPLRFKQGSEYQVNLTPIKQKHLAS